MKGRSAFAKSLNESAQAKPREEGAAWASPRGLLCAGFISFGRSRCIFPRRSFGSFGWGNGQGRRSSQCVWVVTENAARCVCDRVAFGQHFGGGRGPIAMPSFTGSRLKLGLNNVV